MARGWISTGLGWKTTTSSNNHFATRTDVIKCCGAFGTPNTTNAVKGDNCLKSDFNARVITGDDLPTKHEAVESARLHRIVLGGMYTVTPAGYMSSGMIEPTAKIFPFDNNGRYIDWRSKDDKDTAWQENVAFAINEDLSRGYVYPPALKRLRFDGFPYIRFAEGTNPVPRCWLTPMLDTQRSSGADLGDAIIGRCISEALHEFKKGVTNPATLLERVWPSDQIGIEAAMRGYKFRQELTSLFPQIAETEWKALLGITMRNMRAHYTPSKTLSTIDYVCWREWGGWQTLDLSVYHAYLGANRCWIDSAATIASAPAGSGGSTLSGGMPSQLLSVLSADVDSEAIFLYPSAGKADPFAQVDLSGYTNGNLMLYGDPTANEGGGFARGAVSQRNDALRRQDYYRLFDERFIYGNSLVYFKGDDHDRTARAMTYTEAGFGGVGPYTPSLRVSTEELEEYFNATTENSAKPRSSSPDSRWMEPVVEGGQI